MSISEPVYLGVSTLHSTVSSGVHHTVASAYTGGKSTVSTVLASTLEEQINDVGNTVLFWFLAVVIVGAAIGVIVFKKPVYSALCLALVMICLAVNYAVLSAPFLFVMQIIVYTGAIMMLFLFVVMLVGIRSDPLTQVPMRGHRIGAFFAFLALMAVIMVAIGYAAFGTATGVDDAVAEHGGEVEGLAALIFGRYVFAFEATSALLITAAVGAMVLAHRERTGTKVTQRSLSKERFRKLADGQAHVGSRSNTGVFARSNAISAPALLPDGSLAEESVSSTLAKRGEVLDVVTLKRATEETFAALQSQRDSVWNDSGRDVSSRAAPDRDALGRDVSSRAAPDRDALGRDVSSRDAMGRDSLGRRSSDSKTNTSENSDSQHHEGTP